ncbi:Dabb family protein [Candidatus Formimonas warabiya]|uniref:Stress protein n=1 Tax=Formimonas warabiya TaxID=1761012 RepID=A0A3G1KMB1_FORW1|nr:Dabb family protein [Candidatus Formimonas warabiya]ATW23534.1 stress protein [Candidatus Formimonas warabiya]
MITNNLLIKLKERNNENVAKAKDVLLSMKGKIEVLRDLQVEVNIRHGESSYDILLITKFSCLEDLESYLVHPIHVEVSKYIAGVLESGAAVCYES